MGFRSRAGVPKYEFYAKIVKEYQKIRNIKNLKTLFYLRILEREIANAIWVPWHALKAANRLPFKKVEDYKKLSRAENAINYTLSVIL